MPASSDLLLTNAKLVLRDEVVDRGWIAIADGAIVEIGEGEAPERGLDLGGDTLIPGLIELHTDHLEAHIMPRPKVRWHALSAVLAYDAQIAASGITTVYDSLRVGTDERKDAFNERLGLLAGTLAEAVAQGLLRAEHRTHLRCEICSHDVVEETERFLAKYPVHLMSLMDHTPGQRQFRDLEKLKIYYLGKTAMNEEELAIFFDRRIQLHHEYSDAHRRALVAIAKRNAINLASHDDTTLGHVEESLADGVSIAEFPTTEEAARASHEAGIAVMMGAPNLIRGGSHSGNVAATTLAECGALDIFSSDYVPASLIQAAFELPRLFPSISLPEAVATVTATPAKAACLPDRGVIARGKRADLVRVLEADIPVIRSVWREGERII